MTFIVVATEARYLGNATPLVGARNSRMPFYRFGRLRTQIVPICVAGKYVGLRILFNGSSHCVDF